MSRLESSREDLDFPIMIVRALEALSDKHRRQILINLKRRGVLAYSELLQATSLDKGTLNHHVEKLMMGALIRNFRGESPASQYSSFYELSNIAQRLVDNIFDSFTPVDQLADTTDSASGVILDNRVKESDYPSVSDPTVATMPLVCAGSGNV